MTVNIKFYSGIERELGFKSYNQEQGIILKVKPNSTLKTVLNTTGYRKQSHHSFFLNNERIGLRTKLQNGDQISCISISAGG